VVKTVTGETVTSEELGGASVHSTKSGVAHFVAETEEEGILLIRKLLSYLPQNNLEEAPIAPCFDPIDRLEDTLNDIIPENTNKPYDVKDVILSIVDNGEFLEVQRDYAPNIVTCFARFNGMSVGIVANQPKYLAGVLDINASRKAARFVRFCDAFNIPLVTFVDVPGFLPGTSQEFGGIIKHGAKLLYAFAEATVAKITIITRKAYGGAYDVMSSKHIGADVNFAYPTSEIAVMGPEGAINIIHKNSLTEEERAAAVQDYREKFANPYKAASLGYIDEIIYPRDTRKKIIGALDMTQNKRKSNPPKKHGNIPL